MTLVTAWVPPLLDPPLVDFPGLALSDGSQSAPIGTERNVWLNEPAWLATGERANVGVRQSVGCIEAADLAYMPDTPTWHYVVASGWPFYAFHGGGLKMMPTAVIDDSRAPAVWNLPSWVPTRQNHGPSVPVWPCWKGLLLNVVFWSAAAFLPVLGFRRVRRVRRRRKGQCLECAYPSAGVGVRCPECGAVGR